VRGDGGPVLVLLALAVGWPCQALTGWRWLPRGLAILVPVVAVVARQSWA
jgi:hypothetical protein